MTRVSELKFRIVTCPTTEGLQDAVDKLLKGADLAGTELVGRDLLEIKGGRLIMMTLWFAPVNA